MQLSSSVNYITGLRVCVDEMNHHLLDFAACDCSVYCAVEEYKMIKKMSLY